MRCAWFPIGPLPTFHVRARRSDGSQPRRSPFPWRMWIRDRFSAAHTGCHVIATGAARACAPVAASEREIPGDQDRHQVVLTGCSGFLQPRGAGQFLLRQHLQRRQPLQRRGGARSASARPSRQDGGRRRVVRNGGGLCGRGGLQRRNPGRSRGRCIAAWGIRTVQPFPHPCSAAPPACAADAPTRCASRAGGCRYAAARPPARCPARRHCDAAVPAALRPRG